MGTIRFVLLLFAFILATAVGYGRSGFTPFRGAGASDAEQRLERAIERHTAIGSRQPTWPREAGGERVFTSLKEAFEAADACAVQEIIDQRDLAGIPAREFWAGGTGLLLADLPREQPIREVFANSESPLFGGSASGASQEFRFFKALLMGNQLKAFQKTSENPDGNPYLDLTGAAAELQALVAQFPENGAYPFFLAQVLRLQGIDREKVRELLVAGAKAPQFNTHLSEMLDQLQKASYKNVATFAWMFRFYSYVTEIDFSFGSRGLRGLSLSEPENKWLVERYSKRWIDLGLKRRNTSAGYGYSTEEYYLGHNLKMHLDGVFQRTWKEVEERQSQARQSMESGMESVSQLLGEVFVASQDTRLPNNLRCDFRSWENLFELYKKKLEGGSSNTR